MSRVAGLELDVIERRISRIDRVFAVEKNDLVLRVHAIFDGDVALVGSDRDNLVLAEFTVADEFLQVRQVGLGVAADEVLSVDAGQRPRGALA